VQDWCDGWTDRDGNIRVRMGGSWRTSAHACRSACRYGWLPEAVYPDLGFRVALSL
jgi:formylglycine-generating enzyme required for sulfatase activity